MGHLDGSVIKHVTLELRVVSSSPMYSLLKNIDYPIWLIVYSLSKHVIITTLYQIMDQMVKVEDE